MKGTATARKASRKRDAGVREGARIDDDECDAIALRRLNLGDQLVLRVALERDQFMAAGAGQRRRAWSRCSASVAEP